MRIAHRLGHLVLLGIYLTSSAGCDGGAKGEAAVAPPIGAIKSVAWEPSADATVSGYYLYYGTQSRGPNGTCDYEHSLFTSAPPVTLKGLNFNTRYFLSVSAFNGKQSPCSAEISFVTDPA
jgi:hypothetical protein